MVHGGLKNCDIVAIGKPDDDSWTPENVKRWVEAASGKISFQSRITDQTTHLVVSEKKFNTQSDVVKDALARKEQGQKIHIVTWEWLVQSIRAKSRRSEMVHLWLKKGGGAGVKAKGASEPRSTQGLMTQVFTESTNEYLSDSMKKQIEKRKKLEEEARKEEAAKQLQAIETQREQNNVIALAEFFRRGILKSRNELLTDKYHVYVDEMGFAYDVTLQPMGQTEGQSAIQLQIYESNESKAEPDKPHSYAFNAKAGGTKKLPQNNIIVCIGCNFLTAFRCFKKAFKESTGVAWIGGASTASKPRAEFKYVSPTGDAVVETVEKVDKPREKGKGKVRSPEQPMLNGEANGIKNEGRPIALDEDVAMHDFANGDPQRLADTSTSSLHDGAFTLSNSVLGKRKEDEGFTPGDGPAEKMMKTEDFSMMPQQLPPMSGEGMAYDLGGAYGGEAFPRAMAEYQDQNMDYEQEAENFFDFDMGDAETV